jgi:hypothetical protein
VQIAQTLNVRAVVVELSTNPFQPVAGFVCALAKVGSDSSMAKPAPVVVNPPPIAEVPVGQTTDPGVSDGLVPGVIATGAVTVALCPYVTFASAVALAAVVAFVAFVALSALVALVALSAVVACAALVAASAVDACVAFGTVRPSGSICEDVTARS